MTDELALPVLFALAAAYVVRDIIRELRMTADEINKWLATGHKITHCPPAFSAPSPQYKPLHPVYRRALERHGAKQEARREEKMRHRGNEGPK